MENTDENKVIYARLLAIKNKAENFNEDIQHKIYLFLKDLKVDYSLNNNGAFFNATSFDINVIDKLEHYIKYIDEQQEMLEQKEKDKEEYIKKYMNNN